MKIKKILFSVFMIAAMAVMSLVLVDAAAGDADTEAQGLFNAYYNNGTYTKQTVINVKDSTTDEVKAYFHAGANALERTTYYTPGELWMTNAEKTINSGYGTGDGYTTHFKKVDGVNKVDYTVKGKKDGRDWTSMESAFVTLFDLKGSTGWDKSGNVYFNTTNEVLEQYREFVAPMWLSGEETKNYVVFVKATMENTADGLVLKLYVKSTNSGQLVDGANLVFAQALITDHICYYSEAGHNSTHHYDACTCGAIDNTSEVKHTYTETWSYNVKTSTCSCGYSTNKTYLKFEFWTNDWSNSDNAKIYIYYWDKNEVSHWALCTLEEDNGMFGDKYSVVIDADPAVYTKFIVVRGSDSNWNSKYNQTGNKNYSDYLSSWQKDAVKYYM